MKIRYRVKPHPQYDDYVVIQRKLPFLPIWLEITYLGPIGTTETALSRAIKYIDRINETLYQRGE